MDLSLSKPTQAAVLNASLTSNTTSTNVASGKTHISVAKGSRLNALAQQRSQDEIANGVSEEFSRNLEMETGRPALREPTNGLTNKSQVLLAMLRYQSLSNTMDSHQLANAAASFAAQSEATIQAAQEMSAELDELQSEFDAQGKVIDSAKGEEEAANSEWKSAKDKLESAKNALDNLLKDPNASEEDIAKAKADVAAANIAYQKAGENLTAAKNKTKDAIEAGQKILDKLNAKTAELNKKYSGVVLPGSSSVSTAAEHSEKALSRTAVMIMLITEFIKNMDEVASEKLKSDLEINRIQTKARQAEMKRKSDEYMEQTRKAEETQKMTECIGKILGGLAIALGAITTIFGGAGTTLMAIGIALMVLDPILEATTGKSLTGMIMDPLMEHVLTPLMNFLGDIVTKIFDYTPLGLLLKEIDKATGANMMDTIHTAVTAAVVIMAIVAVALVAKSAAKFLIKKMTKAMTAAIMQAVKSTVKKVIDKIIPQIVKGMAKKGTAAVSQLTRQITQQIEKLSAKMTKNITGMIKESDSAVVNNLRKINLNHLNMGRVGITASNSIVQSGMNMNIANIQLEASKKLADFQMANTDIKILRDLLDVIINRFKQDQVQVQSIGQMLSDTLQNQNAAGHFVTRNMKA
ncbi:type III secretion system translocon subunit SctE [Cedecea davisae]|uniref:Type III secretion system translocon subunit SctE n=1 Tax=Cedecea davisae TaxID=158484 RepID=A0ABS6DBS8_9ENTR|nr:type III secretion system translocon subunit SctE [Cedecea davisae]MBU4680530.1 type III secretion system translocon subunit SctE [Cedecea davisae]MBU4685022.1 type III secretion system translocon subunit SctE [Cedecea davisae]